MWEMWEMCLQGAHPSHLPHLFTSSHSHILTSPFFPFLRSTFARRSGWWSGGCLFSSVRKIPLEILGLSSSQSQSGSFALILGEKHGKRRLPIIIGMFEAQSIAIQIEKINPNRPLTHDLFKSFAEQAGLQVVEIIISDLREGVFFSRIVCTDGERTFELDARPSDAIAIGLRFGVPIYTVEQVLSEAGIILSDQDAESDEDDADDADEFGGDDDDDSDDDDDDDAPAPAPRGKGTQASSEELSKMLAAALEREDYEKAAQIRDELNRRGQG